MSVQHLCVRTCARRRRLSISTQVKVVSATLLSPYTCCFPNCAGLVLYFYASKADDHTICQTFAIPPSTLSRYLSQAESALEVILPHIEDAQIRWPTIAEQRRFAELLEAKEPLVVRKFGFVDGKNFRVKQPSDVELQNAQYNGWLHSVLVTGTLLFGPDGCILWVRHNAPGSWNDSETSATLMEKLLDESITDQDLGIVSDTAFVCSNQMANRVVSPLKEEEIERFPPAQRAAAATISSAITSLRQSAEWGMGAVEKPFRRLQVPLPLDKMLRGRRLINIFRLFNFRVRRTQISQIRTVFSEL